MGRYVANIPDEEKTKLSPIINIRHSEAIEKAVEDVLNAGYRTGDIYEEGTKKVTCSEMGDLVVANIK